MDLEANDSEIEIENDDDHDHDHKEETEKIVEMIEEDEEPYDPFEELEQEEISLPLIKASVIGDRQRFRKMKSPPNKRKNDPESLFIYKDFDTSLTAVKGPLKSLAKIE